MPEFPNPQNEPGMERRLMLVFALTFLVIIAFQPILKKYLPQPPPPQKQEQPQAQQATTAPAPPATVQRPVPASPTASKQASAESETVVENDLYRITFSNRGGQAKSWILKKFDDDQGRPLELVNLAAAPKYGYPLSLWTYDET